MREIKKKNGPKKFWLVFSLEIYFLVRINTKNSPIQEELFFTSTMSIQLTIAEQKPHITLNCHTFILHVKKHQKKDTSFYTSKHFLVVQESLKFIEFRTAKRCFSFVELLYMKFKIIPLVNLRHIYTCGRHSFLYILFAISTISHTSAT